MGTKPIANAGPDITKDLAIFTLGGNQQINIDGGAAATITDFGDGTSISSYKWYLLEGPAAHGASFSSDSIQSPTLNTIDTWGNYRLFMVVTNDAGTKSEEDPLLAPDSSFCVVRLISLKLDLEKPASGERNWHTNQHALIGAAETLRVDFDAHTIVSHVDTTTTGAELDLLSGAGYATADGTETGTKLHKHPGSHIDGASLDGTKAGVIKLGASDAWGEGYVWPSETMTFSSTHNGAWVKRVVGGSSVVGWDPNIVTDSSDLLAAGFTQSPAVAVFYATTNMKIRQLSVALADSGFKLAGSSAADWKWNLHILTPAQYQDNLWHTGAGLVAASTYVQFQAKNHWPASALSTALEISVTKGTYMVVLPNRDPYRVDPTDNEPGAHVNIQVLCTRA
mgnify:CR=1 FL=1